MPLYLFEKTMIAFSSPGAGRHQPGVRFDVDDDGQIAVDASGYPRLTDDDCRILADWLRRQADRMGKLPTEKSNKVGRPKKATASGAA